MQWDSHSQRPPHLLPSAGRQEIVDGHHEPASACSVNTPTIMVWPTYTKWKPHFPTKQCFQFFWQPGADLADVHLLDVWRASYVACTTPACGTFSLEDPSRPCNIKRGRVFCGRQSRLDICQAGLPSALPTAEARSMNPSGRYFKDLSAIITGLWNPASSHDSPPGDQFAVRPRWIISRAYSGVKRFLATGVMEGTSG